MLKIKKSIFTLALLAGASLVTSSCNNDDNGEALIPSDTNGVRFAIASSDINKDRAGGATVAVFSDLTDATRRDVQVYDNTQTKYDAYTQMAYNPTTHSLLGGIYTGLNQNGDTIGVGFRRKGYRVYSAKNNNFVIASAGNVDQLSNTGFFGNYTYVLNGATNGDVYRIDENGNSTKLTLDAQQLLVNGVAPTSYIGIQDRGNNEVAIGLYYADIDRYYVAFADYNMNITSAPIGSDIAGRSITRRKSIIYNLLLKDDAGNLYAIGSYNNSAKAHAARIPAGTKTFDATYDFDIYSLTGNNYVRRATHITGSKFLLEMFPDGITAADGTMEGTGRFYVADFSTKTVIRVTGLPTGYENGYVGWGSSHGDKAYIPFSGTNGLLSRRGTFSVVNDKNFIPVVYAIDANTGVATLFMSLKQGELIKFFTVLK